MINFSSISHRSILGKILRLPLRLIPNGMILPILQGRLKLKKWVCGAGNNNGYWLGSYEIETQELFCRMIKKGSIVYDIGANVGFFTILASELTGQEGRVYAFEPLTQNVDYLKRHIALNNCKNIEVIEAAVSDTDGIGYLKFSGNSAEAQLSESGDFQVKTINLDSFFEMQKLIPPDYMKIDVEGAEMLVFYGAESLMRRYMPVIILSLHEGSNKECCNFLRGFGYDLKSVIPDKDAEESHCIVASVRR